MLKLGTNAVPCKPRVVRQIETGWNPVEYRFSLQDTVLKFECLITLGGQNGYN
jgi:hypothetical protein